jgi:predicted dehydrogenase
MTAGLLSRTRVALVGCGAWGVHILRDLRQLGCDVVVVARSEQSRRRAENGGASAVVADLDSVGVVAGVVVATSTTSHAEVVERCLDLRCPIFVEKPLTADLESAERLAAAAGERIFVMDKWRYHPGVEALAQIARDGELGAPVGLRTTRVGLGHPHPDVDAVWILAPHDLSIGLEVLGEIPPVRAASAEVIAGEATGLIGLLGERPWLTVDVSTTSDIRRRAVQLICEEGTAVLTESYAEGIEVGRGRDDARRTVPISSEMPLLRELRAFLEHLDGGPPPRSGIDDAVEIVRRVEELRAAAGLAGVMEPAR